MKKPARKPNRSYEQKADPDRITPIEYSGLQQAFDHFNRELFDEALPDVFITYQRRAHSRGYFSPDRFSARGGKFGRHELALNPDGFVDRTDEQICSTLAHEMAHVWQQAHGSPGAGRYHNKQWAAKMKSIGLMPSSTGMVGGKQTGYQVSHYIIPGGAFAVSFKRLAATRWKLNLQSALIAGPNGGRNSKTKFTCADCGQNAWGKPDLAIICKSCGIEMKSADADFQSYEPEVRQRDQTRRPDLHNPAAGAPRHRWQALRKVLWRHHQLRCLDAREVKDGVDRTNETTSAVATNCRRQSA